MNKFLHAILENDKELLFKLLPEIDDKYKIRELLDFCIVTNNPIIFHFFLEELHGKIDQKDVEAQVFSAIQMNRNEILEGFYEFNSRLYLTFASKRADLATFKVVWNKSKKEDVSELIEIATKAKNSEIVKFLRSIHQS